MGLAWDSTPHSELRGCHRRRLQSMYRRLALGKFITSVRRHVCAFCATAIQPGETYIDAGLRARSHVGCFKNVSGEVNQ